MSEYIMSLQLFEQLSCISGFNNINGKTYMEHITIIQKDIPNNTKDKILKCTTAEGALNVLSESGILYTHEYNH